MYIQKSPSTRYRRDEVALRTTCIKNVKFKIIKIRTACQYADYLHYSENLNAERELDMDIAGLNATFWFSEVQKHG